MIKLLITHFSKTIYYVSICCLIISTASCKKSSKLFNNSLVFRYNEHKNIGSLDPAFAKDNADIWVVNQLFNGLVQMDNCLQVQPCIAKNWTLSEEGLLYSFTIREDVFFHKHKLFGTDSLRTVKASDFEYSLNRLLDKKIASPGRWVLNKVDRFWVEDDSLFKIKLKQPFPAFLGLLTMKYCSVVPKEIIEHDPNFRSNPIGTGPFQFKRWKENIKLVLRRHPNYFEKDDRGKSLPYLEAVAITFLPDKQSEFLQFVQGNIDFVSGLDASYKDEILNANGELRAKYSKQVNMIRGPYLNTEYLAFYLDSKRQNIHSEKLRKAINFGFDRKKMITYLRNGIGIPANGGFIPKGLPGYSAAIGFQYNPEKARQLINQYKKETGDTRPQITISTTSNYLSFCEYIQREIQKLGVIVKVEVIPAATLKTAKSNGKLDFFRASWVADYPDAENYLSLYYSKNFAPNGPNYTHFKNEIFDQYYEAAFKESDLKKREILYEKMDALVMKKAPIVPLFYDEVVRFTGENITGLGINPVNLLDLRRVIKN